MAEHEAYYASVEDHRLSHGLMTEGTFIARGTDENMRKLANICNAHKPLVKALEHAKAHIEWFIHEFPEQVNDTHSEMLRRVVEALKLAGEAQ